MMDRETNAWRWSGLKRCRKARIKIGRDKFVVDRPRNGRCSAEVLSVEDLLDYGFGDDPAAALANLRDRIADRAPRLASVISALPPIPADSDS
jgi:hypothetical protein